MEMELTIPPKGPDRILTWWAEDGAGNPARRAHAVRSARQARPRRGHRPWAEGRERLAERARAPEGGRGLMPRRLFLESEIGLHLSAGGDRDGLDLFAQDLVPGPELVCARGTFFRVNRPDFLDTT